MVNCWPGALKRRRWPQTEPRYTPLSPHGVAQSDEENRIYYEPRCIEGNYGLPGLLHGRRMEERAFAEGRGPDPRTSDNVGGVQSVQQDPLQ